MRLTIIKPDSAVYIDGDARIVDLSTMAANIHAVQWSDDANKGWIEFAQDPFGPPVPNEDITSRAPYQPYIDEWYAAAPYYRYNALINPDQPVVVDGVSVGYAILKVMYGIETVPSPQFWVECEQDLNPQTHYYDPTTQSIKPIPV